MNNIQMDNYKLKNIFVANLKIMKKMKTNKWIQYSMVNQNQWNNQKKVWNGKKMKKFQKMKQFKTSKILIMKH